MVPYGPAPLAAGPFAFQTYTIKRPFWSFLGRKFHVFEPHGGLVAFVKHPLLRLRQEFTIFADESETRPLLTVRARQIIGLNIAMDVFDAASGERVGTIQKRGLKSIVRDTWDLLDPHDQPVGKVEEHGSALLRRFFPFLLGEWTIELRHTQVGFVKQVWRWFTKEFVLDLSNNHGQMDPRFALACAILALMAETERERKN